MPKKSNTLYIHERMYAGSMLLKEFFNADGNGLSNEDLETEQYQVQPGHNILAKNFSNRFL